MNDGDVMSVASQALWTTLKVSAPLLLVGLVVGLVVSVFQAVTQIQEQTLVFVPKIVAMVLVLIIAGPWMMSLMTTFTTDLFGQMTTVARN